METLTYIMNLLGFFAMIVIFAVMSVVGLKSQYVSFDDFRDGLIDNDRYIMRIAVGVSALAFAVWGYMISGIGVAIIGLIGGVLAAPAIIMMCSVYFMIFPAMVEHKEAVSIVAVVLAVVALIGYVIAATWRYQPF